MKNNLLKAIIIVSIALSACTTTKDIQSTQELKIEYRDRIRVDSVLTTFKDSVFINGDTVKIYRDRWRDRVKINTDTVYKSVDRFIDRDRVVKIELTFFEKAKIAIGWSIIGFILGLLVMFLLNFYFKWFV